QRHRRQRDKASLRQGHIYPSVPASHPVVPSDDDHYEHDEHDQSAAYHDYDLLQHHDDLDHLHHLDDYHDDLDHVHHDVHDHHHPHAHHDAPAHLHHDVHDHHDALDHLDDALPIHALHLLRQQHDWRRVRPGGLGGKRYDAGDRRLQRDGADAERQHQQRLRR